MRIFTWLWLMFFVLCLLIDGTTLWAVRENLSQSLAMALDGGLVAGLSEQDLIGGRYIVDQGKADQAARKILLANLASSLVKSLELEVVGAQHQDQACLGAVAGLRIPLLITRFSGLPEVEIRVRKWLNFQGGYK